MINLRAFLSAVASNQRALTPAVCQYFFANVSPFLIMFWHDFGQKGEGAPWSPCFREERGTL